MVGVDFKDFLKTVAIPFQENVPLRQKTRIKCGGMCHFWIQPKTLADLKILVRYLYSHHLAFDIVGQTSNLFFRDSYSPFVVISTTKLSNYIVQGSKLICECGTSVVKLSRECIRNGYEGFYGLVGLPGTVGAAIYNNSGCYGCSLSSMLHSVSFLNENGSIEVLNSESIAFSHRSSVFKKKLKQGVILSVELNLHRGSPESETEKAEKVQIIRHRIDEQCPRTLGSIYSEFVPKIQIKIIIKILNILNRIFPINVRKVFKNILLRTYGYKKLDKYISDSNLNTFVWRDDNAEHYFNTYVEFMQRVHKKLVMEIEVKP